ncbi:VOC family protein [Lacihabitans sp. LS3-19]|uniref:VOC family protein n=1 Tax=Lacihabitans sp. LS3-19 TaxID=2487335 RepID=UPI0020CE9DDB|nr:VOC family protein [Lacihabitans sp. LS3-19]MCP9769070.1 VOC family protein [Lacihabitans sp. LS3-19]
MKPKISFITIAVTDLNKSISFYNEVFGFPTKGIQEGSEEHCMFDLDDKFGLVLYRRQEFLTLIANPNQTEKSAGFILSHNAQNKKQVDEILHAALKARATQIGKTQDEPWGYSANITDLDGHHWEIVYMPH